MGYLQSYILEYLRGRQTATLAMIADAVSQDYRASRDTVAVTLWRMVQAGLIARPQRGLYTLRQSGYTASCDRLLVAGVLDRLTADYGDALRDELQQRGWHQ